MKKKQKLAKIKSESCKKLKKTSEFLIKNAKYLTLLSLLASICLNGSDRP